MAKPALKVVRNDSWANLITELGTSGDKTEYSGFVYESFDVRMLEELYAQDDMAGRICELLPETMLREGYDFVLPEQKDGPVLADTLLDAMDELSADEVAQEALEFSRATGGAVVLLGIDDGSADPGAPLNEARIRKLEWLSVLGRGDIKPVRYYTDTRSPKYGQVELYEVTLDPTASPILAPSGVPARDVARQGELIHESRLIRVDGFRLPKRLRRDRQGWGGAVLERCYRIVRDFQMSWRGASLLLSEFGLMLFKIEGLAQHVNAGNNEVIVNRYRQIALGKSTARAIVADAKEQIERVSTEVSGLPEMLQQMALRMAAAARYPVTLLMGQSPAGLNATGDSDIRNFYDYAKAAQRRQARPILLRLAKLLMLSKQGPLGREPDRWWLKFRPLWQLTDAQKAELMAKVSLAHDAWVRNQIVLPEEIALSSFTSEGFKLDIQLDSETRDAMRKADLLLDDEEEAAVPGKVPTEDPEAVDPQSALNGAQVTAALDIVARVAKRELPRETGVAMLTAFFPLNVRQADRIMGSVGHGFFVESESGPPPGAAVPTGPTIRLNSNDSTPLLTDKQQAAAEALFASEHINGQDWHASLDTYALCARAADMLKGSLSELVGQLDYLLLVRELKKRGITTVGQVHAELTK